MNAPKSLAALTLSTALLLGCGAPVAVNDICWASYTPDTASSGSDFKLAPASTDLDIYPGGSTTVQVAVQGANGAANGSTVTISGSNLPQGVTIAPVTATVGSTTTLTITASNDVINSCFTGEYGTWTAAKTIALTGSDSAGNSTAHLALNVALENKNFVPSTPSGLPVFTITTSAGAPIDSKDDYVDATLNIVDPSNKKNAYTGTMEIKGHGNSTWGMPKKPYRLKLDAKASLLGMTSDSNWILLANYDDKAMIRNDVAFNMSTAFGMFWTPNSAFIELYLNGQYEGIYQLAEKVEVSKSRLNIGSINPGDDTAPNVTGGYLGEIDHYLGATFCYTGVAGNPICLEDPDPPDPVQSVYFQTAETNAEKALYAPNFTDPTTGWSASWDQTSLVDWFLVEEITGNEDAADWSSDYFYKPRSDDRFYMGPVWDMDITFGNFNYSSMDVNKPWVSSYAHWYAQLFKDPNFVAAVKARWVAVRPQVLTYSGYIAARQTALTQAAANNYGRWPTLGEKVWPNPVATGTYSGEIGLMQTWLTKRIAYMDATYGQ